MIMLTDRCEVLSDAWLDEAKKFLERECRNRKERLGSRTFSVFGIRRVWRRCSARTTGSTRCRRLGATTRGSTICSSCSLLPKSRSR